MMRVADYVAKFIFDHGVKDVFMLSGGGIMHLTDGLACNKDINVYCLHHEQAVSMAIDTYARTTGNFAAGYFTTGPGATNALTGLAGAWLDSSPCLFISGQSKISQCVYTAGIDGLRQIGVQEVNIVPVVQSLTKYCVFVDDPNDMRFHLEKAFYLAKHGRPGPVWLDIPLDVQGAMIDPDKMKGFVPESEKKGIPKDDINRVVRLIEEAKRPVILAGQGIRIAGAIPELLAFANTYQIPIVTTFLGVDIIASNHPRYVGRIGIKGTRAGNLALQNSDFLLIIGTSLPIAEMGYDCTEFAREAKKIAVDIEATSYQRDSISLDLFIQGDAKVFLQNLCDELPSSSSTNKAWLEHCIAWREKYPVCLPQYGELKNKINLYYFIDHLSRRLDSTDAVVTDAGSSFFAGSQGILIKEGMRYVTSGGFASMGFGIPASIGVCVARGKRRVMCITGDGSFQQNIQELQSVVHHKLPIKIFVINNNGYLSIRYTQSRYFKRFIGEGPTSGVTFPETGKIAKAYGIKFFKADNNAGLDHILDATISYKGPVICEIVTPPRQLIIPTVASSRKEDGTMVSRPLEDMFPFLNRKEFKKNMIIKPLDE
jgi:acetolactate synthase-1/2/3 large subunit